MKNFHGYLIIMLIFATAIPLVEANYISIETTIISQFSNKTLNGSVFLTNKGNDISYSTQSAIQFINHTLYGPSKDLAPNEKYSMNYSLKIDDLNPGTYPLIVRTTYKDANGYRFSAVSLNIINNGKPMASDIIGKKTDMQLTNEGHLTAQLRNSGKERISLTVSLLLPQELYAEKTTEYVNLKGNEEKELKFKIKNFSGLNGSKYIVYIILEYDKGQYHITDYLDPVITIAENEPKKDTNLTLIILAATLVILIIILSYKSRHDIKNWFGK